VSNARSWLSWLSWLLSPISLPSLKKRVPLITDDRPISSHTQVDSQKHRDTQIRNKGKARHDATGTYPMSWCISPLDRFVHAGFHLITHKEVYLSTIKQLNTCYWPSELDASLPASSARPTSTSALALVSATPSSSVLVVAVNPESRPEPPVLRACEFLHA
jgi:hypothetical protein